MKSAFFIIAYALCLVACSSPASKQITNDATVVASGHSIRWVAPADSEGTAYLVETNSGKIILSQSITKTDRAVIFGSQDPEIAELIKVALSDSQIKNAEYMLYYKAKKK